MLCCAHPSKICHIVSIFTSKFLVMFAGCHLKFTTFAFSIMRALYDCAFYRIFSCGLGVLFFVFRSKLWQAFATIWPYGEHLSQFGSCSNIYPSPLHLTFSVFKDCATLLSQLFGLLVFRMHVCFSFSKSSYRILFSTLELSKFPILTYDFMCHLLWVRL